MSKFLHDTAAADNDTAIAITRVFSENSLAENNDSCQLAELFPVPLTLSLRNK